MVSCLLTAILSSQASVSSWSVNSHGSLIWDGKPYLPVGLEISGDVESVAHAHAAGIDDVIVDLPSDGSGWDGAFKALEKNQMRYLIRFTSAGPTAVGYRIEPESYRIPDIATRRTIDLSLPGTDSCYGVMAAQTDGEIAMARPISMTNDVVHDTFDVGTALKHVLLLYPHVTRGGIPDAWDALNRYRDQLLRAMLSFKPGVGLRGVLDPLGVVSQFPGLKPQFVPTSSLFRLELEAYLRHKYTSVDAGLRAWQLSAPDFDSFGVLSRLVPLWSQNRGVSILLDPVTNKQYLTDMRKSTAWADIQAVVTESSSRRYGKIVNLIQSTWNVPVLQSWSGPAGPTVRGGSPINGVACLARGETLPEVVSRNYQAAGAAAQWSKLPWQVAAPIDLDNQSDPIGALRFTIEETSSLGYRGWYVRSSNPALIEELGKQRTLKASDSSLSETSPAVTPFPVSANGAVHPMRLGVGGWTLPSPGEGEPIDLGPDYRAYRFTNGGRSFTAIWRVENAARVRLRFGNPKGATFTALDGSDVSPKVIKNGVEVTITTQPLLVTEVDEVPIPENVFSESLALIAGLDAIGVGGNLQKYALDLRDLVAGFDREPERAFREIRQIYWSMNLSAGKFNWIEAENCREHSWSEPINQVGCSGGSALKLKTLIPTSLCPRSAKFTFTPVALGEHTLWIAARIGPDERDNLRIQIGDQVYTIKDPPINPYGDGYAWYKLGTLNLPADPQTINVDVNSETGIDMALDSILLTPGEFHPNGPYPPIVEVPLNPKKKR